MAAATALPFAQGRGRQVQTPTPPPPVYRTAVARAGLDVIVVAPTSTSAALSIRSTDAATAIVTWSPDDGMATLPLSADTPATFAVPGLRPNQRYSFRVTTGAHSVEGAFITARSPEATFQFVVQADSHLDGNTDPTTYLSTLRSMAESGADFLVDLGDTFMVDKYPNYRDAAAQYTAQRHYLSVVGRQMATFLVLGNHDGEVGWPSRAGQDVRAWARSMRERVVPSPTRGFYSWSPEGHAYAWTWGAALFVVLDPFSTTHTRPGPDGNNWAWTLGRAQYDWLETTLATTRAPHRFVFIHHLVGGQPGRASEARGGAESARFFEWGGADADGTPGFTRARRGWPRPIHDLLRTHGVDVVFHGHDHLYAYQPHDGIVYQAVPQPGHVRGDATGSAPVYGYRTGTILGSSGFLKITVSAEEAQVAYLKIAPRNTRPEIAHHYRLDAGAPR